MKPVKRKETDLYPPLLAWLEGNGYTVHAEVNACDIVARRGDELVIVEMKLALNLELLLQVVQRQEAAESVYAAVPTPKTWDRRWRGLMRLLRRLEVGLLLVHLDSSLPRVTVEFHPVQQQRALRKQATRALLAEMSGRSMELNIGGSARGKRITAYREQALLVALGLEKIGPCSPAALRALGTGDKTYTILRGNHYGWFERLGTGIYGLTAVGRNCSVEYAELTEHLRQKLINTAAM